MDSPVRGKDGSWSLYSQKWGEGFHSTIGAYTETQRVYGRACFMWSKWGKAQKTLTIAELGFGIGYGFCLANTFLQTYPSSLHREYVGYDLHVPITLFPLPQPYQWLSPYRFQLVHRGATLVNNVQNTLVIGDVKSYWDPQKTIDIVFWDPFSPKKAPECWTFDLLRQVYLTLARQGCLVTYSSARYVRKTLHAAGFRVESLPLERPKREATLAWKV